MVYLGGVCQKGAAYPTVYNNNETLPRNLNTSNGTILYVREFKKEDHLICGSNIYTIGSRFAKHYYDMFYVKISKYGIII